jgi:DNA-binding FrmR family transcriptional regulator
MSHTIKEKQNLILRAKRIQGRVEALVRALDEERDRSDVLQLMSAARGGRRSAARGQECGSCDAAYGG